MQFLNITSEFFFSRNSMTQLHIHANVTFSSTGDHKQLRPSVATYELSKNYRMDVSLFERMIINGMDYRSLKIQHRMSPEISCLITPSIYPALLNHESVLKYESIKGVSKNLFFFNHDKLEDVSEKFISNLYLF